MNSIEGDRYHFVPDWAVRTPLARHGIILTFKRTDIDD
jgi:hypothetical protein